MDEKVFAAAPSPKEFYAIRGAAHNDTFHVGGTAYFDVIKSFIDRTAAGQLKPAGSTD